MSLYFLNGSIPEPIVAPILIEQDKQIYEIWDYSTKVVCYATFTNKAGANGYSTSTSISCVNTNEKREK